MTDGERIPDTSTAAIGQPSTRPVWPASIIPGKKSRGIGFSFGYNRNEGLNDYHTGRELVIILVDNVSRGGNLLLDIGPRADGTIPPIMEERLLQIGDWLKINGEAIYGSKPWKVSRQWSAGEVPKSEYNNEFNSAYSVTDQVGKPEPGKASIEAFFTTKGSDLFAILPRWPGRSFIIRDVTNAKSVMLLGSSAQLKFKATRDGLLVELPDLPEELLSQPVWVLKVVQ
jgi:alpha-L-fucosidase